MVFNCDGASNSACLTTGAQVIESLSFDHHTVSYPVFGMGMLIIGFLIVAFYILSASQLSFLNLGHVGSAYSSSIRTDTVTADIVPDKHTSSLNNLKIEDLMAEDLEEGMMPAKEWDIENAPESKSSIEEPEQQIKQV